MEEFDHGWILDHNDIEGSYVYESPDGGKTIKSRPAAGHPIEILARGELPIDTWYKVYGNKNGT